MRTGKTVLIAILAAITSCQNVDTLRTIQRDVNGGANSVIEFNNYVDGMTRSLKHSGGASFVADDAMGVWGFQTTGEYNDVIFNNQRVYCVDGTNWTYNNKKLWNVGSTYVFYGFYPYSDDLYTFTDDRLFSIERYVSPAAVADQQDLMISEQRNVSPFNTVDMIFHHILSNINFQVKISDNLNTDGISAVKLLKFGLHGVKNTGKYDQTGWSKLTPVGVWSAQTGTLDIPEVTNITLNADKTSTNILTEYLVIPQSLYSKEPGKADDVYFDAVFRIEYSDGTASTFIKHGIRLAGITGISTMTGTNIISSWDSNNRYNYTLAFNPTSSTRIWEADGDGSLVIDPEDGDTLSTTDDTPTPGIMRYNPDDPNVILLFEDTDGDGKPDTWNEYPIVWEDVDDDGLLEGGIDRDKDGHIDNIDGESVTQQVPGGDPDKDPSDGNPKNPTGKDVILIHYDSDGDGDVDADDEWIQLQKDPTDGRIMPAKETEDATIEFTATVTDWDDATDVNYTVTR